MPRYKFQWANLPRAVLEALVADENAATDDAPEALRRRYGPWPDEDFVRDNWELLRDVWLDSDPVAREAVVDQLWAIGVGQGQDPPIGKAAELAYLRSCRNARRLRQIVLGEFITMAEPRASRLPSDHLVQHLLRVKTPTRLRP